MGYFTVVLMALQIAGSFQVNLLIFCHMCFEINFSFWVNNGLENKDDIYIVLWTCFAFKGSIHYESSFF